MTVVPIPSAPLGDRAVRPLNCTSACSSLRYRAGTTTPSPNLGSALRSLQRSDTFVHSRTQTQPRPQIFAYSSEETCRLLAAHTRPPPPPPPRPPPRPHFFPSPWGEPCGFLAAPRGGSHAMSMRFPRAAATEAT